MAQTPPVVIGVVGDVRRQDLTEDPGPTLYLPVTQFPLSILHVVARGAPASQVVSDLRAVVRGIDPSLPLGDARTVIEARAGTLAAPRFRAALVAAFAGLTLVLVAVGLYGVLADAVSRRTRELAVRLALGARPGQVVGHVMRDAFRVAAVGLAVGLAGALVLGRVLASLLFQVGPADPVALGATCLLVIAVAGLAAFLPAWRAARIAPAEALAGE
jgi:ABC-type antimicrobial peptide transport system permease subunit